MSSDLPRLLSLNSELRLHSSRAVDLVRSLCSRVGPQGDLEGAAASGLSLLELKNLLMVDYLSDLAYLFLRKSAGRSIQDDDAVQRLIVNRTVMEKIRPIEHKLK